MSDLDKFTQEMKTKKDNLLKAVKDSFKNDTKEKIMENYTDEDKDKLKDLLDTFSKNNL